MTLSDFKIKINPKYAQLVRALSNKEYQELKESIREKGLHLPIIINQENVILDGHHRYQICNELDIEPRYEVMMFQDLLEEKQFVIDVNDKRRQLNDFAKSELAYKLEEIESEKAKLRQLSGLNDVKDTLPLGPIGHNGEKGKTREIVSKKVGISPTTYERAKTIIKYGTEEQKTKLREGKSKINKEYVKIQRDRIRHDYFARLEYLEAEEKRKKNKDDKKNNENNNYYDDRCSLINGDFMQVQQLPTIKTPNILIFTDPPYADTPENLLRYEGLAKFADRVLKDGDSIVFYVGHIIIDKVFQIFDKYPSLKYWWIFAVKHSGNHTKIYPRNVFSEWKPMLWYVKGKKPNNLIVSNTFGDFIKSIHQGKYVHEWQQSTVEAEHIIKYLTIKNHSTVLDPMMGSGTTGLAALYLERKFIGIEIDKTEFEKAETRLKNYCWSNKNKKK